MILQVLVHISELQQFKSCNLSTSPFLLCWLYLQLTCDVILAVSLSWSCVWHPSVKRESPEERTWGVSSVRLMMGNVGSNLKQQRNHQLLLALCCAVTYRLEIPVCGIASSPQFLSVMSTNKRSEQEKMSALVQGKFVLWSCLIKHVINI